MVGPKKTLILQRMSESNDGISASGFVSWSDVSRVQGVLINRQTSEDVEIDKPTSVNMFQFWCNYSKEYTIYQKDRFILDESTGRRVFNIKGIRDAVGESHKILCLTLKEVF